MLSLFKKKDGSQKIVISLISIMLIILLSIGIFFIVRKNISDSEYNPLQDEILNNDEENNDSKNNEQNDNNDLNNENSDISNDNEHSNMTNQNQSATTNNNNTNTNTNNGNQNITSEEVYFQKFQEEVIVDKAWETLDVSWKPLLVTGALIPANTNTLKPEIVITKSSSVDGEVTTGDEIIYTISVKNIGNLVAKNVILTDKIDTNYLENIIISDEGKIDEDFVITWELEEVLPNEEKTVTITANIKDVSNEEVISKDEIIVANKANVTGDNIISKESNEVTNEYVKDIISGTKETFVLRDGEKVKADFVLRGETLVYVITLKNEGSANKELTLTDTLPECLENVTILTEDVDASLNGNVITWNVVMPKVDENGASEATLVYSANVKEDASGSVSNSVVSSDDTNIEPTITPVITTLKTSSVVGKDVSYVTTDDIVEYKVKITNTSKDVDAKNIEIVDFIPNGTTFVENSISNGGKIDENGKITWNIDVEKDSSTEVSFKVKVSKNDLKDENNEDIVISNIAYVNKNETNKTEDIFKRAEFNVEKTADKNIVKLGENITYTIKVTNNGTCEGTQIITDTIDVSNITLIEDSFLVDGLKTSDVSYISPQIKWNLTLGIGETKVLTYTVKVNDNFVNKEVPTKISNDVETSDDNSSSVIPVITVEKYTNKDSAKPNEEITYTIVVTNTSDIDIEDVVVSDKISSELSFVENDTMTLGYEIQNNEISWKNQTLSANTSYTYTFTVKVNEDTFLSTNIENIAYVNDTPSNEVVTTVEEARISVNKIVDKDVAKAGDILNYTVKVVNDGNISGRASFEDVLVSDVTYVDGSLKLNGVINENLKYEDGKIILDSLTVGAYETVEVTYSVVVNENVEKAINNKVTLKSGDNDSTSETITNIVTKAVKDEQGNNIENTDVHEGQILVYNIKISNKGNVDAKEFEVTDIIPNGTKYVDGSATHGGVLSLNNDENEIISWNVTLNADEEVELSFKVEVLGTLSNNKDIKNTAIVNNVNTNTVQNNFVCPIISSTKTSVVNGKTIDENGTTAVKAGDIITYTITVKNDGNYEKSGVVITDIIPEGTTFVLADDNVTPETIEIEENGVMIKKQKLEFVVTLPALESISKSFSVRVNDNLTLNGIKNTAKVDENDTNTVINPLLSLNKTSEIALESKILTSMTTRSENKVTTGTILKYNITLTNNSSVEAKNVVIKDSVPANTELLNTGSYVVSDEGIVDEGNKNIEWIVDVKENSSKIVSFYVRVLDNTNGAIITNEAYVNDEKVTTTDEYIKAIVSGKKTAYVVRNGEVVEADSFVKGEVVTYKIVLTNTGSLDKEVTITDTLPMTQLKDVVILGSENQNVTLENGVITWSVRVLGNSSETLEYTGVVRDDATGTVENKVSSNGTDKIDPVKTPIIVAEKSSTVNGLEVESVTTGDVIKYTIKVTNTSNEVDANNITITDVVPNGTELVENSITGNGITLDNKNIAWEIEKISINSFEEVSFEVRVLKNEMKDENGDNTIISNIAYVNGKETNKEDLEYVKAKFDVSKTSNKEITKVGEGITYTVTVTNNGTGKGEDTVTDIIPVDNVTLDESSIIVTKGTTLFETPNLNWTLNLEVGESGTLTYTVKVNSGTKIENTVITPDDEDTTTTPVILIEKQATKTVRLDGKIEYTIVVTNTSDIDVVGVDVKDTLKSGLIYNSDAMPSDNVSYDSVTRTLTWKNQTIYKNSSNTYTFSVSLDTNVIKIGDKINNTAFVGDISSNETTTNVEDYNITYEKSVDKTSAKVGDTLTYTITLKNSGNIAGYADVEDVLSSYVTYDNVSGITITNGGSDYVATYTDGKVVVTNIKVSPNVDAIVTFKVVVNKDIEVIKNKAKVTVDEDSDETNETITMVISKSVKDENGNDINGKNVKVGDKLVYSITVNNIGNKEAKSVVIKDIVPQGTEFVSADGDIVPNDNNELIWNKTIPSNEKLTVTFTVKVLDLNNDTKITNIASVDGNSTNEVENTYVEPIISGSKSSVASSTIDGKVVRGTNITYTVTVTNNGGLLKEDVSITDIIPDGTEFVSADDGKLPVNVEVELDGNTTITKQILTWTVDVEANSSVSKSFVVKVLEDTVLDSITNTATVDGKDTNTTEDEIYYENKVVRFSKKTDTIVGKNIVMVLDLSNSMNMATTPKEKDTEHDEVCTGGYEGNGDVGCNSGAWYDHYYDNTTRKYYHYKTRLAAAKEAMIAFLKNIYTNPANESLTVDIITFESSIKNNVTVNKDNYESVINGFSTPNAQQSSTSGGTNIYSALVATKNKVKSYTNGNTNMVIFLGDGAPSEGSIQTADGLGEVADEIYNKVTTDTTIYTIGFAVTDGSNADNVLSKIATSGEAILSQSTSDLVEAFNKVNVASSYLNADKESENGMIKDYSPTTDNLTVISEVDGTKDIVVRYGTGEKDYYTFSPTDTQTSIEVLNSKASQDLLLTKGLEITYDANTKTFNVNLRNCTINSTLPIPTIQVIYY